MIRRWVLGGIGALAVAAGGMVLGAGGAGAASPNHRSQGAVPVLHSSLTPSTPNDSPIFGVPPGGIPWSIAHGQALLRSNGTLQVNVARLIDPETGSNPVPYLAASVYCDGSLEATTATVPFSHQGNAHLRATVGLPAVCSDPVVLLNPAAPTPKPFYIAFTGSGS